MAFIHTIVLDNKDPRADLTNGSLFFIGTATVLIRYAGFTILTDPNFLHRGEKVHFGYGQKSTRLLNPAINIEDLPPLDLVILSHMHEDHFDRVVSKKLPKHTMIVTTPSAEKELKKQGFSRAYALETWQKLTLTKGGNQLHITAMPGKHGPGPINSLLPAVIGSMLEFETPAAKIAWRLYISGDTLMHKQLKEIPKRYPLIDTALLHLGGTKLFGLTLTMDGKQGAAAIKLLNPRLTIPIHYHDYKVFKSTLNDFSKAVLAAKIGQRVHYLMRGETYTFTVPEDRR